MLDLREVDLIYNDYIRVMTVMFEKLKTTYNTFVNRFLNEEQRRVHNVAAETTRFALPSEIESGNFPKAVNERSIASNSKGQVVLRSTADEESKTKYTNESNHQMVGMKSGDEDLVEDEVSIY